MREIEETDLPEKSRSSTAVSFPACHFSVTPFFCQLLLSHSPVPIRPTLSWQHRQFRRRSPFGAGLPTSPKPPTAGLLAILGDLRSGPCCGRETAAQPGHNRRETAAQPARPGIRKGPLAVNSWPFSSPLCSVFLCVRGCREQAYSARGRTPPFPALKGSLRLGLGWPSLGSGSVFCWSKDRCGGSLHSSCVLVLDHRPFAR